MWIFFVITLFLITYFLGTASRIDAQVDLHLGLEVRHRVFTLGNCQFGKSRA